MKTLKLRATIISLLAAWTVLAMVACHAPPVDVPNIAGTRWAGADSDGDHYVYTFRPDGSLHYQSPSGFWKNGTWKQDGDRIYMETNKRFAEYTGVIRGNRMEGKAWNIKNHRWTWSAVKQ